MTKEIPTTYEDQQEAARLMWNAAESTEAIYIQRTEQDGSEWRIADIHASIRGYVNIATGSITRYGKA